MYLRIFFWFLYFHFILLLFCGRALLVVFTTPFVHARPRFVCSNDPSCY